MGVQVNPHKSLDAYPPDHQPTLDDRDSDLSAVITNQPIFEINQESKEESSTECNNTETKVVVTSSFNDKSKINKLIEQYLPVFDISIKKEIKCHPVRLQFRSDIPVVPFKCTSSRPIPFALREAARKEV